MTSLGYAAFANTESLETVTLNAGLKSIGERCFENSSLGIIVLPETLESIGASAFRSDSSLKTLYIPDSVSFIGAYALYPMSVQGMIEVKCSIGARENLGRPTTTAIENKNIFMANLKSL